MSLSTFLSTERTRLRPITSGDRQAVEHHLGRLDVARMLTSIPHPYPHDLFPEWLAALPQRPGETWGVEADGVLIGCASLTRHPPDALSLGYWYAPEAWGRGYATEVAAALRDLAFVETGVPWLFARRMDDNPASGRVLEKTGFVETGTMRHYSEARRGAVTSITYQLTRDAWLSESVAGTPVLVTSRLVLRPLGPADAEPIASQVDDLEVTRWLALVPHPYTIEDARVFLAHSARQSGRGRGENFAITLDGALIGVVGVRNFDATPEIGWWLGRSHWGRGLMSEAVEAVLEHLFSTRGLDQVHAGAFEQNLASLRIQEKMGFRITGRGDRHCLALGHDLPHLETVVTRSAFAARKTSATDKK